MTPKRPLELVELAAGHLASKGIEEARLDAELLLAHVLGVRRLDLYLQFERPLIPDEVDAYREATRRRADREPLQYITGEVDFRELTLAVDPRVLIPRPETEVLVGAVLDRVREAGLPDDDDARFLDLGTGSGAIALSLLHEGPFAGGVATDVSDDALAVARVNAEATGLDDRLELRSGSLWDPIGPAETFGVIVSNPPYVAESEGDTLQAEVRDHEPVEALFSGADGLDVIRGIVAGAPDHLSTGGLLAVELGLGQAEAVADLARDAGFAGVQIARDLTGRPRILLAVRD